MKTVLKIKLAPTKEQFQALLATMEQFNAACNYIGKIAFQEQLASKFKLQKLVYKDVSKEFGLSAQATIRAKKLKRPQSIGLSQSASSSSC